MKNFFIPNVVEDTEMKYIQITQEWVNNAIDYKGYCALR